MSTNRLPNRPNRYSEDRKQAVTGGVLCLVALFAFVPGCGAPKAPTSEDAPQQQAELAVDDAQAKLLRQAQVDARFAMPADPVTTREAVRVPDRSVTRNTDAAPILGADTVAGYAYVDGPTNYEGSFTATPLQGDLAQFTLDDGATIRLALRAAGRPFIKGIVTGDLRMGQSGDPGRPDDLFVLRGSNRTFIAVHLSSEGYVKKTLEPVEWTVVQEPGNETLLTMGDETRSLSQGEVTEFSNGTNVVLIHSTQASRAARSVLPGAPNRVSIVAWRERE